MARCDASTVCYNRSRGPTVNDRESNITNTTTAIAREDNGHHHHPYQNNAISILRTLPGCRRTVCATKHPLLSRAAVPSLRPPVWFLSHYPSLPQAHSTGGLSPGCPIALAMPRRPCSPPKRWHLPVLRLRSCQHRGRPSGTTAALHLKV